MSNLYEKNYENNQYKGYEGLNIVKAIYKKQKEPTYEGNLLIEALPLPKKNDQIFTEFYKQVPFSDEERNYELLDKIHAIYRLSDFVMPKSQNLTIQNNLDIIIRNGYKSKKIFSTEYMNDLKATAKCIRSKSELEEKIEYFCQNSTLTRPALGFMICGLSGMGKSTSVDISLNSMPQVIIHEFDNGRFTQITWIKIDCSYNGGIKGICQKFFRKIDSLIGSNYDHQYGRKTNTVDQMIMDMSFLAKRFAIGMLVIDEIQNIRGINKENRDGERTMNFFASLMNESNLPIVFIGTYKALNTNIGNDFSRSRRASGISDIDLGITEYDEEFSCFLKSIWKYQWTTKTTDLTEELSIAMYEHSLGIVDRLIKLYMLIQLELVKSTKKKLTPALIKSVSKKCLRTTDKIIEALRQKDEEVLRNYDDVLGPKVLDYFNTAIKEVEKQKLLNQFNAKMLEDKNKTEDSTEYQCSNTKKAKVKIDRDKFILDNTGGALKGIKSLEEEP